MHVALAKGHCPKLAVAAMVSEEAVRDGHRRLIRGGYGGTAKQQHAGRKMVDGSCFRPVWHGGVIGAGIAGSDASAKAIVLAH